LHGTNKDNDIFATDLLSTQYVATGGGNDTVNPTTSDGFSHLVIEDFNVNNDHIKLESRAFIDYEINFNEFRLKQFGDNIVTVKGLSSQEVSLLIDELNQFRGGSASSIFLTN
jgi:hypothetical protein